MKPGSAICLLSFPPVLKVILLWNQAPLKTNINILCIDLVESSIDVCTLLSGCFMNKYNTRLRFLLVYDQEKNFSTICVSNQPSMIKCSKRNKYYR